MRKDFELEQILRGYTNQTIGIISAYNHANSDAENYVNMRNLTHYLKGKGVKFFRISKIEENNVQPALLILALSLFDLKNIAKKYEQDSFVFGQGYKDDVKYELFEMFKQEEKLVYRSVEVRNTFTYLVHQNSSAIYKYQNVSFTIPFGNERYQGLFWDDLSKEERSIPEEDEEREELKENTLHSIKSLLGKIHKDSDRELKVKYEDLLELPEGLSIHHAGIKHFENLIASRGYEATITAINNIINYYKDRPAIVRKMNSMKERLEKKNEDGTLSDLGQLPTKPYGVVDARGQSLDLIRKISLKLSGKKKRKKSKTDDN